MDRLPGYDAWKTRSTYDAVDDVDDPLDVAVTDWIFDPILGATVARTIEQGRIWDGRIGAWATIPAGIWVVDDVAPRSSTVEEQDDLDARLGAA